MEEDTSVEKSEKDDKSAGAGENEPVEKDGCRRLVEALERKSDQDRELLASLIYFQQKERKNSRRWKIFFRLVYLSVTAFIVLSLFLPIGGGVPMTTQGKESYSALIDIKGPIGQDEEASADRINNSLRVAFEDKRVRAVVLRINSPGGSPVQAGYVYDEIRRLKKKKPEIRVFAVITDIGASAAYFIAVAADEIYANNSSLVGSIGAYMASFGFDKAIDKLGVSRRFYKSGEYKGFSDPFLPENTKAADHITQSVRVIHKYFISKVKEGRGNRLKNDPSIFSGLIWSGKEAVSLGLIDGISSVRELVKEKLNIDEIVDFTVQMRPWERFARDIGVGAASSVMSFMFAPALR